MKPWYATNARNLLQARRNGYTPAAPVAVTLIGGEFKEAADTLYVRPDMPLDRMDWRMLVDAEVHAWADKTIPLERVQQLLVGIAKARPRKLNLRFGNPDGAIHEIEVGDGFHMGQVKDIPAQHRFTWCPINLTGSGVGAKLRRSLLSQYPAFTQL